MLVRWAVEGPDVRAEGNVDARTRGEDGGIGIEARSPVGRQKHACGDMPGMRATSASHKTSYVETIFACRNTAPAARHRLFVKATTQQALTAAYLVDYAASAIPSNSAFRLLCPNLAVLVLGYIDAACGRPRRGTTFRRSPPRLKEIKVGRRCACRTPERFGDNKGRIIQTSEGLEGENGLGLDNRFKQGMRKAHKRVERRKGERLDSSRGIMEGCNDCSQTPMSWVTFAR